MRPLGILWSILALLDGFAVVATSEDSQKPRWQSDLPKSQPTRSAATTCTLPPNSAIRLSIPSSAPFDAIQVPPDFIGFGFETAFLPNYAVGDFSENLINSIAKRVGGPITIRIGGTTGDRVNYTPSQLEDKVCMEGDCPVGSNAAYTLGPSHFEAFTHFQNQLMTFQAPLGPFVNINDSVEYVKRAYYALGPQRVAAIALGNEVDVYPGQYNVTYTIADYVRDATALGTAILAALDLPTDTKIFEVLDLASPAGPGGFTVQAAVEAGRDVTPNVKYAATHWYQFPTGDISSYTPETMQFYLLNHSAIVERFNTGYAQDLAYLSANAPQIDYILSETGSSLIGPPLPFQDSFGAALWAVDFNLYAMSMGVKRVDASQRPAAPHSLWVPDDSCNDPALGAEMNVGPQVRGPWFAVPFVADFIGMSPGRIVRLLEQEMLTAYGMYDATGRLAKVAIVNLKYWSADTGDLSEVLERGNVTLSIPIADPAITSVYLQGLRADAGADALGYDAAGGGQMITWAGETWSYASDNGNGHMVDRTPQNEVVEICQGSATISVEDSGAVMIWLR